MSTKANKKAKHWQRSETGLLLPREQLLQASGRALIQALLTAIGAAVRENMAVAMASLMLNKPRSEVTPGEATSALHDALKIADPVQRAKVIREGWRAALALLSPELVPEAYAGDLAAGLTRLDAGEALGILTPTPTSRHQPGVTHYRERTLGTEVAFGMGTHKTSRDKAIQIATGVGRGKWKWTQPPTLPWAADIRVIQHAVDAGWRDNPSLKEDAMAEGAKLYRGEKPSLEFLAYRQDYLKAWDGRGTV